MPNYKLRRPGPGCRMLIAIALLPDGRFDLVESEISDAEWHVDRNRLMTTVVGPMIDQLRAYDTKPGP